MVCQGRAYTTIIDLLDLSSELSDRNLRDHIAHGHLPVRAAAVRQVAAEQAATVQEAAAPMVDALAGQLRLA
ncbi:MAG: hypothetical protein ABJA34_11930 [Pseudonocardiales bacterium]